MNVVPGASITAIKDSYFMVEARTPFERDGELYPWCKNHDSEGYFNYANRYSSGGNVRPQFWFELEADAMLFKLKFA